MKTAVAKKVLVPTVLALACTAATAAGWVQGVQRVLVHSIETVKSAVPPVPVAAAGAAERMMAGTAGGGEHTPPHHRLNPAVTAALAGVAITGAAEWKVHIPLNNTFKVDEPSLVRATDEDEHLA